ncbi:cell envelope integrity protein TolA [Laspinema palackyanum]|uniref:cell envelope integrity protein TolA n=1 Tax=Laspinema palackyanum TaxID=3231601 RepID=UPI00345DD63C|nr:hypothetical protein [Laspinema sp. D2c]
MTIRQKRLIIKSGFRGGIMKNFWPNWIPYPISIVRSGLVLACFSAVLWFLYPDIKDFDYSERDDFIASIVAAYFLAWIFLLPGVTYSHHFTLRLFGDVKTNKPSRSSWGEGFISLFVFLLAAIPAGIILNSLYRLPLNSFDVKQNLVSWAASWMLSLSYVYHFGYLFNSWRADRKAMKAERKAARKKANEEARAAKELAKAEKRALKSRKQPAIAPSTEAVFEDMFNAITEKEKRSRRR